MLDLVFLTSSFIFIYSFSLTTKIKLKIPSETQTGKMFRLRGKGVKPIRGGAVGDMLCKIVVETPVNLTKKQKELLETLQDTLEDGNGKHSQHSPKQQSWLDNIKRFFDDLTNP